MTKDEVRQISKKTRAELLFRDEKNCQIKHNVLKLLKGKNVDSLFLYVAMGSEVSTYSIAEAFFGKLDLFVPFTACGKMLPVRLDSLSRLKKTDKLGNVYTASEITEDMLGKSIDVTIVPMLAFNNERYRVGYGGGYYDEFLSKNATYKLGMAFDEQRCDDFVAEEHDVSLDVIVTQSAVYGGELNGESKVL